MSAGLSMYASYVTDFLINSFTSHSASGPASEAARKPAGVVLEKKESKRPHDQDEAASAAIDRTHAITSVKERNRIEQIRIHLQSIKDLSDNLEKEELHFDPIYGMIRLAIAGLIYSKEMAQRSKLAVVESTAAEPPKIGIKVAIYQRKIYISEAGLIQIIGRSLPLIGSDRNQLLLFKRHTVKALLWCPPHRNPYMRTICHFVLTGFDALYETYGPDKKGKEKDFTGRGIQDDKKLIEQALRGDERVFTEKLTKLNADLFPLTDQVVDGEVTRNQFFKSSVLSHWDDDQLELIAKSLTRAKKILENHVEDGEAFLKFDTELASLRDRVRTAPLLFLKTQARIIDINQRLFIKQSTSFVEDSEETAAPVSEKPLPDSPEPGASPISLSSSPSSSSPSSPVIGPTPAPVIAKGAALDGVEVDESDLVLV